MSSDHYGSRADADCQRVATRNLPRTAHDVAASASAAAIDTHPPTLGALVRSRRIRCSRSESVEDGDSDSEAGGHAPRRVLWVARLATCTSHLTYSLRSVRSGVRVSSVQSL
eukprot:893970-Pleurochrysis_carterae.AAC.2